MPFLAEMTVSAPHEKHFPKDRLPEIALAGRSNVGKSSLINRLVGRKLAHTSSTPGRTQMLNFYRIWTTGKVGRDGLYLVDMPGYGYAKVNLEKRHSWAALIDEYLNSRETLSAVIQLIDLRHDPQPLDLQMADWVRESGKPYLLIGTKADKIAKSKVEEQMQRATEILQLDPAYAMAFSAETGLGRERIWHWVLHTALGR